MSKKDRARDELINGIQTQDQRAAEWAQDEGHLIVHVTRDRNISGAVPPWERPELGPWLTDPAKLILYDGIVAFDVSRLSRDYPDLAWLRKWAEQNHKKLYVIRDRLRWPDNRDGVLWGVAAERAYQERQDIIERVTRELEALQAGGKLHGRPPFGYTTAGEKYDRRLIPTEEGRTYVPLIFARVIDGWSQVRIADWLNAEGVTPVSGVWWPRTIGTLVKNPTYKGLRCEREATPPDELEEKDGKIVRYRYGAKWVDTPRWEYGQTIHRCPELVDAATWKRANEALSTRPARGHIDPLNAAMLAGALVCPMCSWDITTRQPDSPMYRMTAHSRGRPYLYYRCYGRGAGRRSCGNQVRVEPVDAAVNKIIKATFNVPVIKYVVAHGNEAELEARLEEIKFEVRQLGSRDLSDEEYDAELARLRAERDRVADPELTPRVPDSVEEVATGQTYRELWEALSVPERGPWLAAHGFKVYATKAEVKVSQDGPRKVSATLPLRPAG